MNDYFKDNQKLFLELAGFKGHKHSQESKKKMSETHKKNPSRYWLGKKHTKQTREKISLAEKGKHTSPKTEFKKGQLVWNKGKVGVQIWSEQSKEKLRKSMLGSSNPRWQGGITPTNTKIRNSDEFIQWAKLIKERDNFECQICGTRTGFLHSNHIKKFADYPELRFILTNGVTICRNCDNKWVIHHEEAWESYFNFNLMTRGII